MEPTRYGNETSTTAAQRQAVMAGRPPLVPASALDADARELQRLERQERSARSEYLRQRQLAGPHVQPVSVFRHVIGPDGHGYLREVEVQFDLHAAGQDAEAVVEKAEAVRRAALAGDFPDQEELMLAAKASLLLSLARAREVSGGEPAEAAPRPAGPAYAPPAADGVGLSLRA